MAEEHPLSRPWTLWFMQKEARDKGWGGNYEKGIKEISTFRTVRG